MVRLVRLDPVKSRSDRVIRAAPSSRPGSRRAPQGLISPHGVVVLLVRRPKHVEVLGEVGQIPGEAEVVERSLCRAAFPSHGHRGLPHRPRRPRASRGLAPAERAQPCPSPPGRRPAPVRITLPACGSPWVTTQSPPCSRCLGGQPVGQREQLGQLGRGVPDRLPRRLGERPARPRLVELLECCFEMMATGQIEAGRAYGRADRSRCLVQLRDHRDDVPPLVVVDDPAELPRLAFHEGEEGDRVAWVEPAHRVAPRARGSARPRTAIRLAGERRQCRRRAAGRRTTASRVAPSHAFWSRSSTVTKRRSPVRSATSQW